MQALIARLHAYERLIRLDKPIGTLLLLWPTLIAVWIATLGQPPLAFVWIFVLGTLLMRSAGCAMNDFADRDFDKHVKRTANRPLTAGEIAPWEALMVAGVLTVAAGALIVGFNKLTWQLAVIAVLIAASYPFFKRFFAVPQAYLGIAFGFGIPMAFAAWRGSVPPIAWELLAANVCWAIAYDTEYAMVDRDDDLKIGIKTSAITFGRADTALVFFSYIGYFLLMGHVGFSLNLGAMYWLGLAIAAGMMVYHLILIDGRDREACFAAFKHNNWLGAAVFAGVVLDYGLRMKAWPIWRLW
jgi:4-hydroxybenzoate polyprenyltransferase